MQRTPVDRTINIALRAGMLAIIVLAGWRAVLVACADWEFRLGKPDTIELAERLLPGDAQYHYAHALLLDQKDPTSQASEKEFAVAVAESPRYSDALLAWSVDKELQGDKNGAQQLLLQAQQYDHLLRPAWALANYYYRQDDAEHFWPQAHTALEIIANTGLSEGRFNPTAVFDLSWRMSSDSKTILTRVIPNSLDDAYLAYLMGTDRSAAAIELVEYMLPRVTKPDMIFVGNYLNMLSAQNRIDTAVRTWRALYARGAVPYPGPNPASGSVLTDPKLSGPPLGYGFGWHLENPEQVRFRYDAGTPAFHFEFDGTVEQCPLLGQTVPLTPGKGYRFRARYRGGDAGFNWVISDRRTSLVIPAQTLPPEGSDPKTVTVEFTAPHDTTSAEVTLRYVREPGTTRFQGSFDLLSSEMGWR